MSHGVPYGTKAGYFVQDGYSLVSVDDDWSTEPLAGCFEDVHSYWGYVFERLMEDLRYSPIGVNVCRGWRAAGPCGLLRLMS